MGIFSSKKKNVEVEEVLENKNQAVEVENIENLPESVDDNSEISEVLKTVKEKFDGCVSKNGALYFDSCELTVEGNTANLREIKDGFSAQVVFVLKHKYFDESIKEVVIGVGKTKEDAVKNAGMMFADGILNFVISALEEKGENTIESQLFGKNHIFRKPSAYGVTKIGCENKNSKELFGLIENDIPKYLGTKKTYWIKMFTACTNNKISCEVRINNIRSAVLTQKLVEYVKTWSDTENYHSEREFVLLVQKDETYEECPYSREICMRFTRRTIEAMSQITDKESHDEIYKKLSNLTDWHSLNVELSAFVPEIYCECAMRLQQVDHVVAMLPNGEKVEIRKTQMRSYGYMASAILKYIRDKKPSQQDTFKIIRLSSTAETVNNAVKNGNKQEELAITTGYKVDDEYVIW